MARASSHAQHVLYAAFIIEKRHDVQAVARRMGISMSTLYAYCEGREAFPVGRISDLYVATQDARLISDMLELPRVGLVVAELPPAEMPSGVHRAALRVVAAAGKVAAEVHEAMADGVVEKHEETRVGGALDEMQRAGEALRRGVASK